MFNFTFSNSQKGISLVITFLIMAIMLAVVLSVSSIVFKQIKIISNVGNAISSLYAAESGIERTLYFNAKQASVGATRGLCGICATCAAGNCQECRAISLAKDGSNGCDAQSCNSCMVSYQMSFNGRRYHIDASIENDIFTISSRGFYKEESRAVNYKK